MRRNELKKRPVGDASKLKVGIVVARFHEDITGAMLLGTQEMLRTWRAVQKHIHIVHVAGSFELPLAASRLIRKYHLDAVIALGCIIKGETRHDEYLARAVTEGLMRVSLDSGVPIGLGVLTVNTLAQAKARSRGSGNHGASAAAAALEAALVV